MSAGAALTCALLAGAAVLVRPSHRHLADERVAWARRRRGSAEPTGPRRSGPSVLVAAVRGRRRRSATTHDVLELVGDLAALVRAGAPPEQAWATVVGMSVARVDGTPAAPVGRSTEGAREALERWAASPEAPRAVDAIVAAWRLSEDVGAPLAELLEAVAQEIRHARRVEADVATALAAPRATARLLALLPVAGLALGQAIGARPVQLLLQTSVGRLCGLAAVALVLLGQAWTRLLVARTTTRL